MCKYPTLGCIILHLLYASIAFAVEPIQLGLFHSQSSSYLTPPYDTTTKQLDEIADIGANVVVMISPHWGSFLDWANDRGLKVICHLGDFDQPLSGNDLADKLDDVQSKISAWKNHPAVYGYMINDEPDFRLDQNRNTSGWQDDFIGTLEAVYDEVKLEDSTRPVFITSIYFYKYYYDKGEAFHYPKMLQNCFDVMICDKYIVGKGQSEFQWNTGNWEMRSNIWGMMSYWENELSKEMWYAGQCFQDATRRLPTLKEHEWLTFTPLIMGVRGYVGYGFHRAVTSSEEPNELYPYSGIEWIDDDGQNDVFNAVSQKLSVVKYAIGCGKIPGLVTMPSSFDGGVYADATGFYLIVSNNNAGSINATFTFNGMNVSSVIEIGYTGSDGSETTVISNQYTNLFSGYQVRVYRINGSLSGWFRLQNMNYIGNWLDGNGSPYNVRLYGWNTGDDKKWQAIHVSGMTYKLKNGAYPSRYLHRDGNDNVIIDTNTSADSQWILTHVNRGWFLLKNVWDGEYLDADGGTQNYNVDVLETSDPESKNDLIWNFELE